MKWVFILLLGLVAVSSTKSEPEAGSSVGSTKYCIDNKDCSYDEKCFCPKSNGNTGDFSPAPPRCAPVPPLLSSTIVLASSLLASFLGALSPAHAQEMSQEIALDCFCTKAEMSASPPPPSSAPYDVPFLFLRVNATSEFEKVDQELNSVAFKQLVVSSIANQLTNEIQDFVVSPSMLRVERYQVSCKDHIERRRLDDNIPTFAPTATWGPTLLNEEDDEATLLNPPTQTFAPTLMTQTTYAPSYANTLEPTVAQDQGGQTIAPTFTYAPTTMEEDNVTSGGTYAPTVAISWAPTTSTPTTDGLGDRYFVVGMGLELTLPSDYQQFSDSVKFTLIALFESEQNEKLEEDIRAGMEWELKLKLKAKYDFDWEKQHAGFVGCSPK